MAAALLAASAILIDWPTEAIGASGALLLVLVLPGYSLFKLLALKELVGWHEGLAFTLGLSMATTAIGGLVMSLTPWGIGTQGWVAWQGGVTVVAGGIALARRHLAPRAVARAPRTTLRDAALLVLSGAVVVAALLMSRSGAVEGWEAHSTQLWLLESSQASPGGIRLGVRSLETSDKSYRLQLLSGGQLQREWSSIELAPGWQWETMLLPSPTGSRLSAVEALLYEAGSDRVYRRATLRLVVQPPALAP